MKYNSRRLKRLPSAVGMLPVRSLRLRSNFSSLERFPSAAGIVPVSCLRLSSNPVTREMVIVTPSQAVMGVVVVQFREAEAQWVLILRSVEQSATRLESSGSGIAMLFAHELVVCCAATGVSAPATKMRPPMVKTAQRREIKSFMSVSSLFCVLQLR